MNGESMVQVREQKALLIVSSLVCPPLFSPCHSWLWSEEGKQKREQVSIISDDKGGRLRMFEWMNLLISIYWFSACILWMLDILSMPIYVLIIVLKLNILFFLSKLVLDKYNFSFICSYHDCFCFLNSWWLSSCWL